MRCPDGCHAASSARGGGGGGGGAADVVCADLIIRHLHLGHVLQLHLVNILLLA